jgi:hypothetical protein
MTKSVRELPTTSAAASINRWIAGSTRKLQLETFFADETVEDIAWRDRGTLVDAAVFDLDFCGMAVLLHECVLQLSIRQRQYNVNTLTMMNARPLSGSGAWQRTGRFETDLPIRLL